MSDLSTSSSIEEPFVCVNKETQPFIRRIIQLLLLLVIVSLNALILMVQNGIMYQNNNKTVY